MAQPVIDEEDALVSMITTADLLAKRRASALPQCPPRVIPRSRSRKCSAMTSGSVESSLEDHRTPAAATQNFLYCLFRYEPGDPSR
jgi:hypothetical protein